MEMDGKVALVVGGASGIGEGVSKVLAAAGARLVLADVNVEGGRAVVEAIRATGAEASFVEVDVRDQGACNAMVAHVLATYGTLDAAANVAGFAHVPTPVHLIEDAVWRSVWEVDLLGVVHCMKAQVPVLIERGKGSIVNIASGAGLHGTPHMGAYAAAKFGVVGVTKTAAAELGPNNIRVNAVCPGLVDTQSRFRDVPADFDWESMITNPMGRMGKPSEIGDLVMFLASDRSTWITGEAISIDGGLYCA